MDYEDQLALTANQSPLLSPATTFSTILLSSVTPAPSSIVSFPGIIPTLDVDWPESGSTRTSEQLPAPNEESIQDHSSEHAPNRKPPGLTRLPWWNPYSLSESLVTALRWPHSYASLARSSELDTPFALFKSIIAALNWPFPPNELKNRLKLGDDSTRHGGSADPKNWTEEEQQMRTIPQYVLDHAPLVHLFSKEKFWPCDMVDHLQHVKPYVNYELLDDSGQRYNLTDLDELNDYRRSMYLTSDDNVEQRPDWLGGEMNIPGHKPHKNTSGENHGTLGGRSDAPAVMIVIDKGHGIVDAFYMFFYSYNLGNKVLNVRFGNHVGDWEHTAVRFEFGKPKSMFFSQHIFGEAYEFDAVEKMGKRPIAYSATGTHAMYATPDIHRYILPWGLLHDETDRGPLWDPLLNMHSYIYNLSSRTLLSSTLTPSAPTEWFYFLGHWGDKAYPLSDRRQYYFAGEYHYVDGPTGPIYKNLARKEICINEQGCVTKKELEGVGSKGVRIPGDGEELNEEQLRVVMEAWGPW